MTDWMILDWWSIFTLHFFFRKQYNSTFLLFYVLHASPVVHLCPCG